MFPIVLASINDFEIKKNYQEYLTEFKNCSKFIDGIQCTIYRCDPM